MLQRINLVPQKPLAERIKTLIPFIFSAMAMLIFVIFFSWVQILNIRLVEMNKTIARIEDQTNQATALSSQVEAWKKSLQSKNLAIDQKTVQIATLSKIRGQKKKFSQPLSLIASLLPDTVRCREISFTGSDGKLQGTALDYDDLVWMVRSMQALQIFKSVSLSVTDRATNKDQERIQFTLIMQLV
ncbi:MAG: PilN domain-containing protein [Proteobacteria bacterium]|nr:PilN domain-containing protein [Pseudomonadota bacterium]MBU1640231.1 PilN domain-containing protein [Pseudomonadota bacterium]